MSFRPNLLIDPLPETVEICGEARPIRTSFRVGVLFENMIASGEFSDAEAQRQTLYLWYPEDTLAGLNSLEECAGALSMALWFYRGGRPAPEQGEEKAGLSRRIYDFDEDAERIYAAFLSQYRIDLTETEMHWWKFTALFSGLCESEEIVKIMSYRACDLSKIKNKEERKRMAKLQAIYALPDNRSEEEKVAAVGAAFSMFR